MLTCILKTKTKRYNVHDPCGPRIYIELEQIGTIISAKKNPEAKNVAPIGMQWVGLEIIL